MGRREKEMDRWMEGALDRVKKREGLKGGMKKRDEEVEGRVGGRILYLYMNRIDERRGRKKLMENNSLDE